jgi:hypothetical protein
MIPLGNHEERLPPHISAMRGRERFVGMIHPDWREVCQRDDFRLWLNGYAHEEMRRLAGSESAVDAVRVLNAFKFEVKTVRFQAWLARVAAGSPRSCSGEDRAP